MAQSYCCYNDPNKKMFTRLLLGVAVLNKHLLLQFISVKLNDNSTKKECPYSNGICDMILHVANIQKN